MRNQQSHPEVANRQPPPVVTRVAPFGTGDACASDEVADTIPGFVGTSHAADKLRRAVLAARRSPRPVLVLGETGTGKELVIQALCRGYRPVVLHSCAELAPGTIHSQLFGHETGAFSGATRARKGWFEQADGGVLVLDEVGTLRPEDQALFLRAVEGHGFSRLGSDRLVRPAVRLVLATNLDLDAAIEGASFRRDLRARFRLCVVVPPLRERLEDIPAIVSALHGRLCRDLCTEMGPPPPALVARWTQQEWPDNVRGLEAAVEGRILGLPEQTYRPRVDAGQRYAPPPPRQRGRQRQEQWPWREMYAALVATRGHQRQAAERLGISPSMLSRRLATRPTWREAIGRGDVAAESRDRGEPELP